MKINDLQVDGFGVWTDFHVSGLDNDVNVFYGPNEAGKTTLLHFVRSILYGFSPARRKYLPPVHGGRPGGTINLVSPHGRYSVARHNDGVVLRSSSTLAITAEDGTLQGDHFLKTLLGNVDEATFNNVFAVGLREIQELNTLSDLDAARLLYDLTAGLDRISLPDVMRELAASRSRLLAPDERSTQVGDLLTQRERLQAEINELHALTPRYARLAGQADSLAREINDAEDETSRLRQQARVADIAAAVRDKWQERVALDQQIATFRPQGEMRSNAVARLDRLNARLADRRQKCAELRAEAKKLHEEAAAIEVNEALWRQTPRIEVLAEQQSWLVAIEAQVHALETEVADLEKKLAAGRQQMGLPADDPADVAAHLSKQSLAPFKPLTAAVLLAKQLHQTAHTEAEERRRTADAAKTELAAALAARSEKELQPALERAGELVTQLRRRLQVEERLDQMARRQAELEEESQQTFDPLSMPPWALPALAGVFGFGVVLILAGLVLGHLVAGLGWLLALVGIGGTIGIGATKWFVERSAERRQTSCQKQLDLLAKQTQQAKDERTALDEQLPRGGGPLAARLQTAEKQLAALEEVLPLDAKLKTADQEAQAAEERAKQSHAEFHATRKRWRSALVAAGLPDSLSPKQLRELHDHRRDIMEQQRRLAGGREELDSRRRELSAFAARLEMVFLESDLTPTSASASEQLKQLQVAVAGQEDSRKHKHDLLARKRQLRRQWSAHAKALAHWKRRRRTLLRRAHAKNEEEFRCRALEHARGELLTRQREALDREIAAAMAGQCSSDELGAQLTGDAQHSLDDRRTKLTARLQESQQHFATLLERRGELNQQMKTLTEDRRLSQKLLELAAVEQKLRDALDRWQVLAATERILGSIRDEYERDRQPETLQEASHYLAQLTEGHYRRVWTPLGERVLRVDDDHGRSLPIEVLSRGTREQLFLSLRLALAASYARRGAALPLVLDDVLVNFDAGRARAAAAVLRDFATAGHQIFLFTCHEHMAAMFQEAHAATVTLPDNSGPAHIKMLRPRSAQPSEPKPTRKPRRRKEAAESVTLPLPQRPFEEYADGPADTEAA